MGLLNFSIKPVTRMYVGVLFALLSLAGLMAFVAPLRADNPPTYLFQWGSSGTGNSQFSLPQAIALDSSGNVYVADTGNNRIEKFDRAGNYLTQWSSQSYNPVAIAIDTSNNVYVVDNWAQYSYCIIEKFDSNGNPLTHWGSWGFGTGQCLNPYGIAIDSSNNVYVADSGDNRINKFDSNGNYLTQWNGNGSDFEIFFPVGIAIDSSNNVYVADSTDNRISKFDINGNYLTQWGSAGTNNGQFGTVSSELNGPASIAIDGSDNLYVTDTGNSRIEKFDSNGNYLTKYESNGSGDGQFISPVGIAVDASGNFIYVTDYINNRIEVLFNNTNIPPVITIQPASQNILLGGRANFSVGVFSAGVFGAEPLTYQWTSNNIALPKATNSTLTLTNVMLFDSATYAVQVANGFGSALSSNAVLAVLPELVTTQPANGISVTGAVLNGSVSLGSEETVAWFEWGTNTNYGDIAGTTIVPGNNESNDFSVTLSELSGNIYHYRLVAANDFGIVYGNDQLFTVGFEPTATTLPPDTVANSVTLNATVNPEGWDTTVYFRWGQAGSLNNLTPSMDVGAGVTPLNVSSLITVSTRFVLTGVQIVASNELGTTFGQTITFEPPFVSLTNANWDSVASSADGRILIAVANFSYGGHIGAPIFISTNSGTSWAQAGNAPLGFWETVACSADGSKIIAAQNGEDGGLTGSVYTSTNTGVTWMSNNVPVANWQSVASSADGTKLAAADLSSRKIFTSTNSGAAWTQATNAPLLPWYSIASSADGSKLAAVAWTNILGSGITTNIFTSTDFGVTWMTNHVPRSPIHGSQFNWDSISSSTDGNILVAAGGANSTLGYIFISTNSGSSWTLTATNTSLFLGGYRPWQYVAISADGSKMAAVAAQLSPGGMILSTNTGATWFTNAVPFEDWNAVALSADGKQLVATIGYPTTSPYIYISHSTPTPELSIESIGGQSTVSWLIPSLDFTLQQSPDLLNWSDLTNVPVLNLTNLQNQISLPQSNGNNFFRIAH